MYVCTRSSQIPFGSIFIKIGLVPTRIILHPLLRVCASSLLNFCFTSMRNIEIRIIIIISVIVIATVILVTTIYLSSAFEEIKRNNKCMYFEK